ncbi:MAG: hypothetical protein HZA54_13740 [Planctomycetes bacterium]|nr:hypothetical protein [Planctomycetota bacterium]
MLQLLVSTVAADIPAATVATPARAERLSAQRVRLTQALYRAERSAPTCAEAHALRQSYLSLCCTLHAEQEERPARRSGTAVGAAGA